LAKEKEMEGLKKALKVRGDYKSGQAFDLEL